ncbi:MAG: hypothetical protein ACI9G1_003250 [Pirellulaceae bacterium]|jgi:hypothetical protein
MRITASLLLAVGLCIGCDSNPATTELPPNPVLSPDSPQDKPVSVEGQDAAERYEEAIAPYIEKGRQSYPEAKSRFVAGLPAGHNFFVVTRLRDNVGTSEQVFIAVTTIKNDRITGRIASNILVVKGYNQGDPYSLPESELLDWLISRPDGTEEGNLVGKFLDEWQKTHPLR